VRLSRAMQWVTMIGIVLIVVGMGLAVTIPQWSRNLLLARLGETVAGVPLGQIYQLSSG
jgi:hypothetical protein